MWTNEEVIRDKVERMEDMLFHVVGHIHVDVLTDLFVACSYFFSLFPDCMNESDRPVGLFHC